MTTERLPSAVHEKVRLAAAGAHKESWLAQTADEMDALLSEVNRQHGQWPSLVRVLRDEFAADAGPTEPYEDMTIRLLRTQRDDLAACRALKTSLQTSLDDVTQSSDCEIAGLRSEAAGLTNHVASMKSRLDAADHEIAALEKQRIAKHDEHREAMRRVEEGWRAESDQASREIKELRTERDGLLLVIGRAVIAAGSKP